MSYLTDGTIVVSLDLEWESQRLSENILSSSRAVGGRDQSILWGNYNAFNLPLSNVPSSDATLINEWWVATQALTFYFDSTSYNVYITGDQPFREMTKPYQSEWGGTIRLEQI